MVLEELCISLSISAFILYATLDKLLASEFIACD